MNIPYLILGTIAVYFLWRIAATLYTVTVNQVKTAKLLKDILDKNK